MKFVTLQSFLTCDCPNCQCNYDFGCSSCMTVGVEDHKRISQDLGMYGRAHTVHDVGEVITLINKMRDIRVSGEPLHAPEAIAEFLGLLDEHKVEKVMFIDYGEHMELVFLIIEKDLVELITHPANILRQLVGRSA